MPPTSSPSRDRPPSGALVRGATLTPDLATEVPLTQEGDGVPATFTLEGRETATSLLQGAQDSEGCGRPLLDAEFHENFRDNVAFAVAVGLGSAKAIQRAWEGLFDKRKNKGD